MQPASRTSIQATYGFGSCVTIGPPSATGKRIPERRTRNSEIPSTPSFQEMPNSLTHGCWATSWKPATCVLKTMAM